MHDIFTGEDIMTPFEEYENDYPNGGVDVRNITPDQLANWCMRNDFLYIINGFRGPRVFNANTRDTKRAIVSDIYKCDRIEPTHEADVFIYQRDNVFRDSYVCVYKLVGLEDEEYYVIYEQPKDRLDEAIRRTVRKVLREALHE